MKGTQTLMHGKEKVCDCKFDNTGYLLPGGITAVYNEALLPVCIGQENPVLDMKRWLLTRGLSPNRRDIAPLREFYGGDFFISAHGISLFDNYWFADRSFNDWDAVNAYDNWNSKKDSLVLMMENPSALPENFDKNSPNLTIPGSTCRIWYKAGNDIFMLYENAQKQMQEYRAAGLDKPHIAERKYTILADHIYCKTKSPTSKKIELIPLEEYYNVTQSPERTNLENLEECCKKFGIPKWKTFFAEMIDYDEICDNQDRSLADVGVLRDTRTLEIIGFAPL